MLIKKKNLQAISYQLFVTALALVMIYPILWMLSSSLKSNSHIFINAHQLIPEKATFENYINGWRGFTGFTFGTYMKNSLFITVLVVIGAILSSTWIAYGFARIRFKGTGILFSCMIVSMMLPDQVLVIPQYIFFSKINWLNTYYPLIIPAFFGVPFFVFLIMQFIRGIPKDLDESAKIDGCGRYGIFFKIILPLIVPAMVTTAIFQFYWSWDDFFKPLLYLNSAPKYTVALAIKFFSDPSSQTDWGAMFAMSVVSLLPIVVVFLILQKYIVDGISTTGLKG